MNDIRRADPSARRHVVLMIVVGGLVGALVLVAFERYRIPLSDWALSEPSATAVRVKWVSLFLGTLVSAPLLAFAVYLWSFGARVLRAREFPPPGYRVIRDTPVITGEVAVSRGRLLKALALSCGIASVVLGLLLWRLASMFGGHAG
jgi:hypothetical protein